MIRTEDRSNLLRKSHLFHDISEEELKSIAERFSEETYHEEEVIFEQGDKADKFYLIYSGRVKIVRKRDQKEQQLAVLVSDDYFGEMALIANRVRSATVIALETTLVLVLSRDDFQHLIVKNPKLKPSLDVTIRTRKLARSHQFKWLREDEVVYFMARKHPILLYEALIPPTVVLLLPILLAIGTGITGSVTLVAIGVLILIIDLGWAAWRAIDWGNDYYMVTNQRVVWLEKVIGIYDSRQEAPLNTVLSVGIETDMLGRALDFGHVIVRTFVGKIPFSHVSHPYQASHAVEEYWQRTKHRMMSSEKDAMKDALRAKLGLTVEQKPPPPPPPPAPKTNIRVAALKLFGANTLKLRYEVGETVIYRKHWIVLIQQILQPGLFLAGLLILWLIRLFAVLFSPQINFNDTLFLILPGLMLPFLAWLLYQVADWSNDRFEVTQDQIIDLDRTPFGTEQRSAAQLENILGTHYERKGLWGNLFNYGDVHIIVGGAHLTFENVLDPATVQSDIDRRRMARMARVQQERATAERERMVEWLAAYHQEFPTEHHPPDSEPKPE